MNETHNEPRISGNDSLGFAGWAGIVLSPLVCVWVFRSEILHNSADLASIAPSFAAIGVLLGLLAIRLFHRRLGKRGILLIYSAVAATVGISTMGMVQFLITTLGAPFWFATPENRWSQFLGSVPDWAVPKSPEVIRGFFLGNSSLYEPSVWQAWLVPAAAWGVFLVMLLVAQYCLAHILYPRWANEERLSFPIAQVPLTVMDSDCSGVRFLLAGAALAVAIQGMNALHQVVPNVPQLKVLPTDIGIYIPPPWNGIGILWITFYPCIIGLSMLVPTNILLSAVLFFWLTKAENLAGHMWGLRAGGGAIGFPYGGEQAQGAVLALAMIVLWSARRTLVSSARSVSDRPFWFALAVSSLTLVGYGVALGLRPWVAGLFFGLFLLFMLSIGWLRAAIGLVWNPGTDVGWWVRAFTGPTALMGEGVGLTYLRWFSFGDFRAHALPAYADTMRISDAVRISRSQLLKVLAIGSVLSIVASLWVALDVYYQHGAATVMTDQWRTYQGRIGFAELRSRLDGVVPPTDLPRMLAAAWGFLFLVGLYVANLRVSWWPLHPAGFVVAQTGALDWFWCPMLIAGLVKLILLKSGGLRLYRRALPFFIGLMVGDYLISIVLTILGWALRTPMYKPFPI